MVIHEYSNKLITFPRNHFEAHLVTGLCGQRFCPTLVLRHNNIVTLKDYGVVGRGGRGDLTSNDIAPWEGQID